MLDNDVIHRIAQRLNQAEKNREQIRAISLDHPEVTIEDAYAVQRQWVEMKINEGRKLVGHKIGLTSRAMQISSQITEPDYGALLDDMLFDEGCEIPTDRFIVPRIEVELAFILAKPLRGPNCTIFDVYNATDYVIPALELIDARCHNVDPETGQPRKVFDTISDNAANAGVIMGGRPIKPDALDLRPAVPQRRDRRVRRRGGGAEPSRQRRGLAGEQTRALRRAAQGRADHPRRFVHPAGVGT